MGALSTAFVVAEPHSDTTAPPYQATCSLGDLGWVHWLWGADSSSWRGTNLEYVPPRAGILLDANRHGNGMMTRHARGACAGGFCATPIMQGQKPIATRHNPLSTPHNTTQGGMHDRRPLCPFLPLFAYLNDGEHSLSKGPSQRGPSDWADPLNGVITDRDAENFSLPIMPVATSDKPAAAAGSSDFHPQRHPPPRVRVAPRGSRSAGRRDFPGGTAR